MLAADFRGSGGHEAGQRGDQLAGFIQVFELFGIVARGQAGFYGGGTHQVDCRGGDDFDGGHFGDIAHLTQDFLFLGGGRTGVWREAVAMVVGLRIVI